MECGLGMSSGKHPLNPRPGILCPTRWHIGELFPRVFQVMGLKIKALSFPEICPYRLGVSVAQGYSLEKMSLHQVEPDMVIL